MTPSYLDDFMGPVFFYIEGIAKKSEIKNYHSPSTITALLYGNIY
jgi:hypothetical protein